MTRPVGLKIFKLQKSHATITVSKMAYLMILVICVDLLSLLYFSATTTRNTLVPLCKYNLCKELCCKEFPLYLYTSYENFAKLYIYVVVSL